MSGMLYRKDGTAILYRDVVRTLNGKKYEFLYADPPTANCPLGVVYLRDLELPNSRDVQFYPTAINATWLVSP